MIEERKSEDDVELVNYEAQDEIKIQDDFNVSINMTNMLGSN